MTLKDVLIRRAWKILHSPDATPKEKLQAARLLILAKKKG